MHFYFSCCGFVLAVKNVRPIIGIMTQPADSAELGDYGSSFLNSDYVKWIEASGARSAFLFNLTRIFVEHVFSK